MNCITIAEFIREDRIAGYFNYSTYGINQESLSAATSEEKKIKEQEEKLISSFISFSGRRSCCRMRDWFWKSAVIPVIQRRSGCEHSSVSSKCFNCTLYSTHCDCRGYIIHEYSLFSIILIYYYWQSVNDSKYAINIYPYPLHPSLFFIVNFRTPILSMHQPGYRVIVPCSLVPHL